MQHITEYEKHSTVSGALCLPGIWSFSHRKMCSCSYDPFRHLVSYQKTSLSSAFQCSKQFLSTKQASCSDWTWRREKSLTSKLLPFIGISLCPADTKEINKCSSVLHQVSPASHCAQQSSLSCLHWNGKIASQKQLYENQGHLHMFGRHECCSRASRWQKNSSLYSKAPALNATS